jgi:hypothetical protein
VPGVRAACVKEHDVNVSLLQQLHHEQVIVQEALWRWHRQHAAVQWQAMAAHDACNAAFVVDAAALRLLPSTLQAWVAAADSMSLQLELLVVHISSAGSWLLCERTRRADGQRAAGKQLPHLPVRLTQVATVRWHLALAARASACKPVTVGLDHGVQAH